MSCLNTTVSFKVLYLRHIQWDGRENSAWKNSFSQFVLSKRALLCLPLQNQKAMWQVTIHASYSSCFTGRSVTERFFVNVSVSKSTSVKQACHGKQIVLWFHMFSTYALSLMVAVQRILFFYFLCKSSYLILKQQRNHWPKGSSYHLGSYWMLGLFSTSWHQF